MSEKYYLYFSGMYLMGLFGVQGAKALEAQGFSDIPYSLKASLEHKIYVSNNNSISIDFLQSLGGGPGDETNLYLRESLFLWGARATEASQFGEQMAPWCHH